jgi:hypothetical protein
MRSAPGSPSCGRSRSNDSVATWRPTRGEDLSDHETIADQAFDTAGLRRAYTELDDVARDGSFGAPRPGEWDAEHMLAHIASADAAVASAALAIAAGLRPAYDNRTSIDESNLQRIIRQAGFPGGSADHSEPGPAAQTGVEHPAR